MSNRAWVAGLAVRITTVIEVDVAPAICLVAIDAGAGPVPARWCMAQCALGVPGVVEGDHRPVGEVMAGGALQRVVPGRRLLGMATGAIEIATMIKVNICPAGDHVAGGTLLVVVWHRRIQGMATGAIEKAGVVKGIV